MIIARAPNRMHTEDKIITVNRITTENSAKHVSAATDIKKPSANIKVSLYLIYYVYLCDFVLKFFPLGWPKTKNEAGRKLRIFACDGSLEALEEKGDEHARAQ